MNTNFLTSKKGKSNNFLFFKTITAFVLFLFILIPENTFADNFSVTTQLPTQLDKRMTVLSGFVTNNTGSSYVWVEYGKNGRLEGGSGKEKVIGTGNFNSRVYSLEPGVLYSYRAVGSKEDSGVIVYGETKTFIIESDDSITSSQQTDNASGQTSGYCLTCCSGGQLDESVLPIGTFETTNTTATLRSVVLTGSEPTRGWFEWGTTNSLGRVTPVRELKSSSMVEMKETICGFSPGTEYYFRTVTVTNSGIKRSSIVSFTTQGQENNGGTMSTENSSNNIGNEDEQTLENKIIKSLTSKTNSKDEVVDVQNLEGDSLEGVLAWGSTLRGQFFAVDGKGDIDTSLSFNETKKVNQNFLLASTILSGSFLPNTVSGWGFVTILLYLIISRFNSFSKNKKKKKEEEEERAEEMRKARDFQLELNKQ